MTPVGITRIGKFLYFKIFQGKSFDDLKKDNSVVIQIIDDPEILVALAFNFPISLKLEKCEKLELNRVAGYPWVEGHADCKVISVKDSLGESLARKCKVSPIYVGITQKTPRPISRADNYLIELGVIGSRALYALKKNLPIGTRLFKEVEKLYWEYRRLGGKSKIAEEIYNLCKNYL
ncbi:hypothetical protein Py04_1256 [Pyrococcus sp. ST04]|nr:hypothetical protein Py04_1256 [Pyrococcus sp. ST04]